MLRLQRIFKNYDETGSFNEQVNLYGFVDSHVFLTKTGDLGVILEVQGVDYECLDGNTLDGLTKRLESALKLFDDNYRIYQYLFKRNKESIPYKLYGKPVVDAAIKNRLAYFARKADTLFALTIYYVILFEGFRYTRTLGSTLPEIPKRPAKALGELHAHFSGRKQVLLLDARLPRAKPVCFRRSRASFSRSAIFCQFVCSTNKKPSAFSRRPSTLPRRRSNLPGSNTSPFSITTSAIPISNATEGTSALTTIT